MQSCIGSRQAGDRRSNGDAYEKDRMLISEFQVTERDLADPEAFVGALDQLIEHVEEEET